MRGDPIPDPRKDVPDNTNILVLLLKHLWATPLFGAARDTSAFALTDARLGRESLAKAGLDAA